MKKRQNMVNAVGIPSLFLIFGVLCMVILSLLAMGASRSDLHTSRQAMEQTTAYYEAGARVTQLCKDAQLVLADIRANTETEDAYWDMVSQRFSSDLAARKAGVDFSYNSSARRLSIQAPVSDVQALYVEADILYAPSPKDACLDIAVWKAEAAASWNPDLLLLGEP